MQTLERNSSVKLSFNIPNEMGEKIKQETDSDHLALKAFELMYFFLEKSGKGLEEIKGDDFKNLVFPSEKKKQNLSDFLGKGSKFKRFSDTDDVDNFVRSNRETWKV